MATSPAHGGVRMTAGALALAALFAPAVQGAGQSPVKSGLSITFVSEGRTAMSGGSTGALLDLGTVVAIADGRRASSTTIRRHVFVSVVSAAGTPGVATLRAALQVEDRTHRVRINGVLLSTLPQIIDANAVVGMAVRHVIEIEVPHSEPPGDLLSSISWTAEVL